MVPICAAAAVAAAPAFGEEPPAKEPSAVQSTPTVTASAATATPAPATPAPPLVDRKKALQFGFRPEVVKGVPVFCKEVPIEGTRFTNKRCVRQSELAAVLSQLQMARDAAMKNGCYGGVCNNIESMSAKPRMGMGMGSK